MTLKRLNECGRGLVNMIGLRRWLRAEIREQGRRNREYRQALQIGSEVCAECNRQLRVTPVEFALSEGDAENRRSASVEDVTATYAGTFRCPCGALGWMRGASSLAPRHVLRGPSTTQRRFLQALADGEQ